MSSPQIGVMTYTVLQEALADLEGTLARIAGMGYRGVETYGLVEQFGPERVRRAIADSGLELASAHTPFPAGADADRLLDLNEELGATTLVWSMEREEFESPASIEAGVGRVNEAAERAAHRGMTIAYHNHFAEFSQNFEGRQAYEHLLDHLDPRVVLELDAYWARMGGVDPADLLRRHGPRMRLIHIKDGPARSYEDDVMVPIGQGEMDWSSILAEHSSLQWHLVELERLAVDPFAALQSSYRHLVDQGLSTGAVKAGGEW